MALPVGVLGGMGPLATVDYLQKMIEETPAKCDQNHVACIVASLPQIPDRSDSILFGSASPLSALLLAVDVLERAGAGCITIACNTAHHWADAISKHSQLPLLHIADAAALELKRTLGRGGVVGLMATDGTLASGFYQQRLRDEGFAVHVPIVAASGQVLQHAIMSGIRLTKQGDIKAGGSLLGSAAKELRRGGCDTLLLACTEIPVALASVDDECLDFSVDATRALAKSAVHWWQQQVT
jgi:aspartate racemase